MDPNAALDQLRELLTGNDGSIDDYERAAEVFDGLDEWLSKGGFLPSAWER
jgi:hypothetical protein